MAKKEDIKKSKPSDKTDKKLPRKRLSGLKLTRKNIDRRQRAILRHGRKFLMQRWDNLRTSRREVVGWLLLVVVLVAIGCLQTVLYTRGQETIAATDGGIYAEGVVDKISTINPLYVTTDAERAASGLVYSSLLKLDETGTLCPELAVSYEISNDGKTYTIQLRDNVKWSDGQNFSANDVVLTIELMKNPSVESPLFDRWKNIEVKKSDDLEVIFTRRDALVSFPFMLDFGVLPSHILKDIEPAEIKSTFLAGPTKIVGTGPFSYRSTETLGNGQTIFKFTANKRYFRGEPRLSTLTIQTYETSADLLQGFRANEINVAAGLSARQAAQSLDMSDTNLIQTPLGDGVFALFNNDGEFTRQVSMREALRLGIDRSAVRRAVTLKSEKGLELEAVSALETPLTRGLMETIDQLKQPEYDIQAAEKKLDAAGWKLNSTGKRVRKNQQLILNIVTVEGADYEPAAKNLAEQWQKLGIEIELIVTDPASVQQNYLIPRAYDVLIYQYSLGADPDVSAYWLSSQATARGLNFANYQSRLADVTLNNARTQLDKNKRETNYTYFTKHYWLSDVPAIALYQPNYYYLTAADVRGLNGRESLLDKATRFAEVHDFTVNVDKFKITP
jgi:peptide/nickel transport system substrate-binding protein